MSNEKQQVRQEQAAGTQAGMPGRGSVGINVTGETVGELEEKALARGARFFRPGAMLEVLPYQVTAEALGTTEPPLQAHIYVREAEAKQPQGRPVTGEYYGPDAPALEAAALEAARNALGPEARLEIAPGYALDVFSVRLPEERYHARIAVREVLDGR